MENTDLYALIDSTYVKGLEASGMCPDQIMCCIENVSWDLYLTVASVPS